MKEIQSPQLKNLSQRRNQTLFTTKIFKVNVSLCMVHQEQDKFNNNNNEEEEEEEDKNKESVSLTRLGR